ncbi:MAG: putative FMN-dependent luciferase-like monooxygenase [Bifidobacteriaceae bacterium]|jgi:putative FMN-dependent luciferase-like monooxygenase|nr:putative FMN-dependent luciferase-like monooxygenase [Bifidobacteriaceae bacterium]
MTQIAFFTRLLDQAPAPERYRLALEQIQLAERLGVPRAWVAQHHFHPGEGGLPSPFVFLAHAAGQTERIRLATGVITLPLEDPIRVAEDAAVADALSGGRIDLGLGTGGTPTTFAPFGVLLESKAQDYVKKLAVLLTALDGGELGSGNVLYPPAGNLRSRVWDATFSVLGGARAGRLGNGLLLSRTQPRPGDNPGASLAEIQLPIVEAYLNALPQGVPPRISASRTVFVADTRAEALALAEEGLARFATVFERTGQPLPDGGIEGLIAATDTHLGTPEQVAESLASDPTLAHADEVAFQVHSVDPPPDLVLRSIELFATVVAPALGWGVAASSQQGA